MTSSRTSMSRSPAATGVSRRPGPAVPGRYRQPGGKSQVLLFGLLALCLAISALPSPLYGAYQREFGFSALTLTVIFAVYGVAALAALLVAGKLSDSIGRKPVLLIAQVMLLAGLQLFIAARSPWWLLAARALHGAAIGSIVATVGAALLDLRPARGAVIGRLTGIALTSGVTVGVLGGALLGQFAPRPLLTPYLVAGTAVLVTLAGTALMPEPLPARTALNLHIRPRVPAQIRGPFWFAAVSTGATWAVLGLYLSLAPGLADQAVGSHNLLVGGTIAAALTGTGAVAELFTRRADALRLTIGGDLLLGTALLLRRGRAQRLGHLPDRGGDGRGLRACLQQLAAAACGRHPGRAARTGHLGLLPGRLLVARDPRRAGRPGHHPVRPDPHLPGIRYSRRDHLRCRGMAGQQACS